MLSAPHVLPCRAFYWHHPAEAQPKPAFNIVRVQEFARKEGRVFRVDDLMEVPALLKRLNEEPPNKNDLRIHFPEPEKERDWKSLEEFIDARNGVKEERRFVFGPWATLEEMANAGKG